MGNSLLQILVLAGVALFLIVKLRAVLGTRDGFERPPATPDTLTGRARPALTAVPDARDSDITDHVAEGSPAAAALMAMKQAEPAFVVGDFLRGARGAYEMILMAFENDELDKVRTFLSPEIAESFDQALAARRDQGLRVEARFLGLREIVLDDASFDAATSEGEITVRFTGELTSAVRNAEGKIVEGSTEQIKRQRDVWTFARRMGVSDPNWLLVATGD